MVQEAEPAVDLNNCDREPIHTPGKVQAHGALLVVDPTTLRVDLASANLGALSGHAAQDVVGRPLEAWAAPELLAALEHAPPSTDGGQLAARLIHVGPVCAGVEAEVLAHWSQGRLVLELCPEQSARPPVGRTGELIRELTARLRLHETLASFCDGLALAIRELSGYDRVMIYRFAPDWHGEVIAEAKREDLAPFLGLHYPASDIPRQARTLFALNPSRHIASVDTPGVGLVPEALPDGTPLDMSLAYLRGVSPIHIEYLQNMGVTGSLTFALHQGERLWGLVACHHYGGPRYLGYSTRLGLELLMGNATSRVQELVSRQAERATQLAQLRTNEILRDMAGSENLIDALNECTATLIPAEGFVGTLGEQSVRKGSPPTPELVRELIRWLDAQVGTELRFATDCLSEVLPAAAKEPGHAAGVLAIRLSHERSSWLLWFRGEQVRHVHWAGDPHKPVKVGPNGLRLHPRGSFALWKEEVRGKSIPWSELELRTIDRLRAALVEVVFRERSKLRQLADDLAEANRSLSTFASVASHDLRAPLRGIRSLANFLEEDEGEELESSSRKHLSGIFRLAERMNSMITGLLEFARVGGAAIDPEPLETRSVVEDLLLDLQGRIVESGATITVAEDLPRLTSWRLGVERVFSNLLDNALKYGGEPPRIEVDAREVAPRVYEFCFRDHGPGIPAAAQTTILRAFERSTSEGEGTGLGLAIVSRIVQRLGGSLRLESTPDEGARFFVRLPDLADA
ncbi:MAG: ATP-binding protein [Planctomycetota bacterium]